ncbi:MAG: helix-turn-helix domain-containing protein [Gemmatimonadota bacterium]
MARTRTESRLERILDAALLSFLENGYRGATLQDVAERAEVSVGSVYSYVADKEALFELVLRAALREPPPDLESLPFQSTEGSALVSWVWERFGEIAHFPTLDAAAARPAPAKPLSELEQVLREVWAWQSRYWRAIELIERCARDWPDLHMLYYKQFRRGVFAKAAGLFQRRMAEGVIRAYPDASRPDPDHALRVVVEAIAFFAMHRHVRPDSDYLDEDVSRETVIGMLVAAFTPAEAPPATDAGVRDGASPRRSLQRKRS